MPATALKTQDDVFKLAVPNGRTEVVYFDQGSRACVLRASRSELGKAVPASSVSSYRWGGRLQKLTIGDATAWTLDKARAEAREKRTLLDKGQNPSAAKRMAKEAQAQKQRPATFGALKDDYLAARQADMRPRSLEECTRYLNVHCRPLHGMEATGITKRTVAERLNAVEKESGSVALYRLRSTLSAMFAWAIQEDRCEANPVENTRKSEERPRDRTLSDGELAVIWKAAPENSFGRIVKLLMLTGQRREEIGSERLQPTPDDEHRVSLPWPAAFKYASHRRRCQRWPATILNAQPRTDGCALGLGKGKSGYSGWSRSKETLNALAKLSQEWTLHDLRLDGGNPHGRSGGPATRHRGCVEPH